MKEYNVRMKFILLFQFLNELEVNSNLELII